MAYSDEISSYLDVENSITVRWLANNLGIDLDKARSSLESYKSVNGTISVSYLVVGTNQHGGLSFVVASESELDSVRSALTLVRSEELYAIHKVKSVANKTEIQALEFEQASEILLMNHPNTKEFLSNEGGYITCPSIEVKPLGQRILSASYVPNSVSVQAKEPIKTSTTKSTSEKPLASIATVAAPVVIKSKSSIQANSFFSSKPTPTTVKVEPSKVEVKPEPVATSAEDTLVKEVPQKRVGKIAIDDDEDEEWDAGYKPDPQRLKERVEAAAPVRAVISTGSDEKDLDEDVEEDEAITAGGAGKKKSKVVLRGAMDDYMEDVAIAEHKHAEANPDAPKPKKRKLVEKVLILLLLFCA